MSDIDPRDEPFLTGGRTTEGLLPVSAAGSGGDRARPGLRALRRHALVRDVGAEPRGGARFADAIHAQFPGKLLAYNCSPSFHWKKNLTTQRSRDSSASWAPGIQIPVRHTGRFPCAEPEYVRAGAGVRGGGMRPTASLQEREFHLAGARVSAIRHQRFVGNGYFDAVQSDERARVNRRAGGGHGERAVHRPDGERRAARRACLA